MPDAARSSLPRALVTLGACAGAGALGLLPGAAGACDAVTLLAWLALFAPAAGALCAVGASVRFELALGVPLAWGVLLASVALHGPRTLATPLWAALVVAGLFALGFAVGRSRARRASSAASSFSTAGLLLLVGLVCAGAGTGFGLLAPGAELARTHPELARQLFELSPLTLAYDCAGWDWAHAQPDVYALAGIEWFERRPYPGSLAGPAVLVVGCLLAWLADARARARAGA